MSTEPIAGRCPWRVSFGFGATRSVDAAPRLRLPCGVKLLPRSVVLSAVLVAAALGAAGADLRTLDGRVFRDAVPRRLDEDRLAVRHADGEAFLFFHEVDPAVRRSLGYDTDAELRRLTLELRRLKGLGSEAAEPKGPNLLPAAVPSPVPAVPAAAAPRLLPAAATFDTAKAERWNGLQPPLPASRLAPVAAGEEVAVWDLVNHYRAEPPAAAARYGKRGFRIRGVVERIDKSLATRLVRVFLETPDPAVRPVVEWRVDDKIDAFHTLRDGRTLVAQSGRSKWKILEAGETVEFEVKGGDFEDGVVELKQGRRRP